MRTNQQLRGQLHRTALLVAATTVLAATTGSLWASSPERLASAAKESASTSQSVPWSNLGAKATAQYSGNGLTVCARENGTVRLRCVFQQLEGDVTSGGLWLRSTVEGAAADHFRVVADYVGRDGGAMVALPEQGVAVSEAGLARYVRRGLVEDYSVSVEGVRQDFVVPEAPGGAGPLRVDLAVSGARAKATANGARLELDNSGRKLAYSRLQVVDAKEQVLQARLEVVLENRLAVVVKDANATYPVRIDPTFSDENWVSMGGVRGANGTVYATVVDASGNLYIGGDFTVVGKAVANRIAKWDGSTWSALGMGMNNTVKTLAVSGTNLYAGGDFTTAGGTGASRVAKWNGSAWSPLGAGIAHPVHAFAVLGTTLFVGGDFLEGVVKWNGSVWSSLAGFPRLDGPVYALAVSGTDLYVGGNFDTADNEWAAELIKWNASGWSTVGDGWGGGVGDVVYALVVSGSTLYAGGDTGSWGLVAKWNGTTWSELGSGMNSPVRALAVSGNTLYAGGDFDWAGGTAAKFVAKWNGSSWSALGSGLGDEYYYYHVYALAVSGANLYAGGDFTMAGRTAATFIAKWNGSAWSALGSGLDGSVFALALAGTDLYVGGSFTAAGGTALGIAKWNGSTWSALGSGMGGAYPYVYALAVSGTNLYAGGSFDTAGGVEAHYIAKWDGGSWSPLGSGMGGAMSSPTVGALAVSGTNLYAGGWFDTAGGTAANDIARWDGRVWSPLGSGITTGGGYIYVTALAVGDTSLYAAASFNTPDNWKGGYIARWNGSAWSALGSGMNNTVNALAVSGTDLYAGGSFTSVSGTAAVGIAKWNGSTWSALGSGMGGAYPYLCVNALATSGTNLYAGGWFTTAGGAGANSIAKWDGSAWSALGSGMGGTDSPHVYALAGSGTDLYAGGDFLTAGGKVSAYVTKAALALRPAAGLARALKVTNSMPTIVFQGTPGSSYDVQRTPSLNAPVVWTTLTASSPLTPGADGLFSFTDTNAPSGTAYYRSGPH